MGVVGWSGSGKTTLIERLLPLLRARGVSVSTIKHTHHDIELDAPGKDSFRHRQAGAEEVLVVAGARWALLRDIAAPPDLLELSARLAPVDLVLVEGYRSYPFDKIEVYRPALGKAPMWLEVDGVVAVASPGAAAECPQLRLDLDQPDAIADWIISKIQAPGGPGRSPQTPPL